MVSMEAADWITEHPEIGFSAFEGEIIIESKDLQDHQVQPSTTTMSTI